MRCCADCGWQPSRGRVGLLTPSDLGLGTPAEAGRATGSKVYGKPKATAQVLYFTNTCPLTLRRRPRCLPIRCRVCIQQQDDISMWHPLEGNMDWTFEWGWRLKAHKINRASFRHRLVERPSSPNGRCSPSHTWANRASSALASAMAMIAHSPCHIHKRPAAVNERKGKTSSLPNRHRWR